MYFLIPGRDEYTYFISQIIIVINYCHTPEIADNEKHHGRVMAGGTKEKKRTMTLKWHNIGHCYVTSVAHPLSDGIPTGFETKAKRRKSENVLKNP